MITIKRYRKNNNLTQQDLATKLGVTQRMISYYENSEVIPNGKTLMKLSELLNVSIDELLSDYTPINKTRSDETTR